VSTIRGRVRTRRRHWQQRLQHRPELIPVVVAITAGATLICKWGAVEGKWHCAPCHGCHCRSCHYIIVPICRRWMRAWSGCTVRPPARPDRCTGNLLGPLLAHLWARKQNFWEWNMLVWSVGEVHSLQLCSVWNVSFVCWIYWTLAFLWHNWWYLSLLRVLRG